MADDRTEPHPRYSLDGTAAPIGAFADLTPGPCTYGEYKDVESAVAATWEHADALRREGYMMALEKLRERWWDSPDLLEDIVAILVDEAPGEAQG